MSMTKKDFIQLADVVRRIKPDVPVGTDHSARAFYDGKTIQWELMRDALAEFCRLQNGQFMRERWIAYINGECGPNGGSR